MSFSFGIGKRVAGDSRVTFFRYETKGYICGKGWKISASFHPKLFFLKRCYREFRLTVLGANIHYRSSR